MLGIFNFSGHRVIIRLHINASIVRGTFCMERIVTCIDIDLLFASDSLPSPWISSKISVSKFQLRLFHCLLRCPLNIKQQIEMYCNWIAGCVLTLHWSFFILWCRLRLSVFIWQFIIWTWRWNGEWWSCKKMHRLHLTERQKNSTNREHSVRTVSSA